MIFKKWRKEQALKDLDNIYNALCAEDMDGSFRANYIYRQVKDLEWLLDPKGRGRKRYESRKSRLRITD